MSLSKIFICVSFLYANIAFADACSIAPIYEKARQDCAKQDDSSCFIYTTLHDNKDSWPKMEQVCRSECKGNPAACQKYQNKGNELILQRCIIDPDACSTKNQLNRQKPNG